MEERFRELTDLIRKDPGRANTIVAEWQEFVSRHPGAGAFETKDEFAGYATAANVDPDIFTGKEILEAYFYLRDQHEEGQMRQEGGVDPVNIPLELLASPVLVAAFRNRPKIIEEDADYRKIVQEKQNEWLVSHGQKDFQNLAGLEYLYGSLEDEDASTLQEDTRELFRERLPKKAAKYDRMGSKIYKNYREDPALIHTEARIQAMSQDFRGLILKDNPQATEEEIVGKLGQFLRLRIPKEYDEFTHRYPAKAKQYASSHPGVKEAYDKYSSVEGASQILERVGKRREKEEEQKRSSMPDANRILREINRAREEQARQLEKELQVVRRGPIRETIQFPQEQLPQELPETRRGVSRLDRLLKRPGHAPAGLYRTAPGSPGQTQGIGGAARAGGRLAVQAGARAGAAAAGAIGAAGWPVLAGVAAVFIITFIIVLAGENLTGRTKTAEAGPETYQDFVPVQAPPANSDFNILQQDIQKDFEISFEGFDSSLHYNYLAWGWEKLWNVKSTRFLSLVRGSAEKIIIRRSDGPYSAFVGCSPPTINISGRSSRDNKPYHESLYKIVLMHELSHLIHNCNRDQSLIDELASIVPGKESYITAYSQSSLSCPITETANLNEDYAEMLSYFVNRNITEVEADFGYWRREPKCLQPRRNLNPYDTGFFSLHGKLAAKILGVETASTITARLSCPIDGGTISTPSFQASAKTGHCGEDYRAAGYNCDPQSRRGKSADVLTNGGPDGKDVKLPDVGTESLNWTYLPAETLRLSRTDCLPDEMFPGYGCGVGIAFQATDASGNTWTLHLLHMYEPSLTIEQGKAYLSGTSVGKSEAKHVHVTIGKNIQGDKAFTTAGSTDTRAGWLAADVDLGMCKLGFL